MRVVHESGIEGARRARGLAVIVDVLRAFTVSAYALAGGAQRVLLVATVEEALELAGRIPGALVSAEVDGLPVPGIPISNSPTQIRAAGLRGKTLVQRSSAGTQGVVAACGADAVLAASLVVAAATAREILRLDPDITTLVAMGEPAGHGEDRACALYIEGLLEGRPPELSPLLKPVRSSERYRRVMAGLWPGCPPSDYEMGLTPDVFDFALPVNREDGLFCVGAEGA